MRITMAPVMFHWGVERLGEFYTDMAKAPVDRVVLGELVCSKRTPFYDAQIPDFVETLQEGGKEAVLTSLALMTLVRERKAMNGLVETGLVIEVNDLSMLKLIPAGTPFHVGPLVNVYNRNTVEYLVARGARSICLPPELPIDQVAALAKVINDLGAETEVWAYGRYPLAISGRCYHARLWNRTKDACLFVCEEDPDGLDVETLDDQEFLSVNGVQTLSERYGNLVGDLDALKDAGVGALRLSPHTGNMGAVAGVFREAAEGMVSGQDAITALSAISPERKWANGFQFGDSGAEWTHADP